MSSCSLDPPKAGIVDYKTANYVILMLGRAQEPEDTL